MDLHDRVARAEDVSLWRVVDEKVVILSDDGDWIHELNEVASAIWLKLDHSATVKELINHVCEEFDVGSEIAQEDVIQFIETLCGKGLISASRGEASSEEP